MWAKILEGTSIIARKGLRALKSDDGLFTRGSLKPPKFLLNGMAGFIIPVSSPFAQNPLKGGRGKKIIFPILQEHPMLIFLLNRMTKQEIIRRGRRLKEKNENKFT
jgi:hypothetical protein